MNDRSAAIDEQNARAWTLMLSEPEAALALAERARIEAEEIGYEPGRAAAELNIGWCEYFLTRPTEAIDPFEQALTRFTALSDTEGASKALNGLGVVYHELGRFDRAMDYYTRSLEEARRVGNRLREAITLNNIGEVCLDLGEHKEALDYFLKSYETVPDDREAEIVSNVLLNIGSAFHRMENWPLAREFCEKALVIAHEAENRVIEGQCWLALGRIARSSELLDQAESHFTKALGICEGLKNERQRVEVLLELGSLHLARGDAEHARGRFVEALGRAEALEAKKLINEAHRRLSEAYERLGDYRTALDYYKRFSRFEREIVGEDTNRKIKNITVQYETEKSRQQAEIFRLRNTELKEKTQELEEANEQLRSISELGRRITSSLDLDTVISTLYEALARHLDVSVFGLAILDEAEGELEWRRFIDRGTRVQRKIQKLDPKRSFAAWAVCNRSTLVINDVEREAGNYLVKGRISHGLPAASIVCLPLEIEERVIGVLTVQSYEKNAYPPKARALLEALRPYVSIAVENGLIHDRLEALNRIISGEKAELERAARRISHLANHDSLTGLPNRRLLFELLQKSFDLASRAGRKVAVAFIDLDDFKPINDRYGHSVGDRALVAVAERLGTILRASDTLARVGGDEFVAVLTNVRGKTDIELVCRKLLEEFKKPLAAGGISCVVGLSIGVSIYPDDGEAIEELVNRADAAMYKVKHEQKNGFVFHAATGNEATA